MNRTNVGRLLYGSKRFLNKLPTAMAITPAQLPTLILVHTKEAQVIPSQICGHIRIVQTTRAKRGSSRSF
jgi:hypothetical protein